jgi:hypothetical protein
MFRGGHGGGLGEFSESRSRVLALGRWLGEAWRGEERERSRRFNTSNSLTIL